MAYNTFWAGFGPPGRDWRNLGEIFAAQIGPQARAVYNAQNASLPGFFSSFKPAPDIAPLGAAPSAVMPAMPASSWTMPSSSIPSMPSPSGMPALPSVSSAPPIPKALSKGAARVPGKGDGTKDTVPAMLAPGEAVLNKKAAEIMGRKNIAALNKKGATRMGMI